jgi:hypothetical protein
MRLKIACPLSITRAKTPPTTPALATPTGQPIWPQKGQTDELAYIPEIMNHQVKNLKKWPIKGEL